MFNKQRAEPGMTISAKYSHENPLRESVYLTRDSDPWQTRAQLAYIAARRILFSLQNRPVPTLETDVLVSLRHEAIVVTIPKSGSRSLMAAFLDRWSEQEGVWSETTSLQSLLHKDSIRRKFRVMAVVRNPWDRVYSCYRDKIARLDRGRRRAHRIARYRGLRPFMPFDDFVSWLGSDEGTDESADRHWVSQSAFLRVKNEYRCDHVFKLEQIADEIDRLRDVLGEPDFQMPRTNIFGNTRARHDVYNSYTRAIVEKRYEEDIDRFRYAF
ncbi:MAG: hypothetical protein EOR03_20975 [Mesorhizobium sp.]|nr:MAG: hypothetical protein EOR03_20975 [Mesorhizobium sp.]